MFFITAAKKRKYIEEKARAKSENEEQERRVRAASASSYSSSPICDPKGACALSLSPIIPTIRVQKLLQACKPDSVSR